MGAIQDAIKEKLDGWINVMKGQGTGRDARKASIFYACRLAELEIENLWLGNAFAARIVESEAKDMLREGYAVKIQGDEESAESNQETSEAMKTYATELDVDSHLIKAQQYRDAYGGGAILVGANDGQVDLSQPLNFDNISAIAYLATLRPRECQVSTWYTDPRAPKFGEPKTYSLLLDMATGTIQPREVFVHESRIIRFQGIKISKLNSMGAYPGWGESKLNRVYSALRDFQMTFESVGTLLWDASQGVWKIKNFTRLVATRGGLAELQNRMEANEMSRGVTKAIVMDADEAYERVSTSFAGIPETINSFCMYLAATVEWPMVKLFGQSPQGMNATGASDFRLYYDKLSADRQHNLDPQMKQLYKILFNNKSGPTAGIEPDQWSIVHNPFWQMDEKEQADIRLKIAQADDIYLKNQVLTADEVATSRFGGDEYSLDTGLDDEARALMSEAIKNGEPANADVPVAPGETNAPASKPKEILNSVSGK